MLSPLQVTILGTPSRNMDWKKSRKKKSKLKPIHASFLAAMMLSISTIDGLIQNTATIYNQQLSLHENGALRSSESQTSKVPTFISNSERIMYEENWRSLQDAMINSFFTESETQRLQFAVQQAAYGDSKKMAGATEFCSILVETMEMGLKTLVAAVYHYCSCVTARERDLLPSSVEKIKNNALEAFGEHAVMIVSDAARLKQLEMVANIVIQNSGNSQRVTPDANDCEKLKKLLLAETKDWRALAIRSAASLYRLRGILKEGRPQLTNESGRVAREALRIYAPLASRLGMHRLKNELEGAAFRILHRRQYETVNALAREVRSQNKNLNYCGFAHTTRSLTSVDIAESMKNVLDEVKDEMSEMLQNDRVFSSSVRQFSVTARVKEPYSMWKKMLSHGYNHVLQVPDAVALRIIFDGKKLTDDEPESLTQARERALCYYAQKLCMECWKPLEFNPRFKDYVNKPKPNGYQSLHYTASTNWGGDDWTLEIQVRSGEMHKVAEFGLASHWDYEAQKEPTESSANSGQDTVMHHPSMDTYLRKVQEWHWQQHSGVSSPTTFEPFLKAYQAEGEIRAEQIHERTMQLEPYIKAFTEAQLDLARENVFVFLSQDESSEGKVLSLPNGARVLDALREAEKQIGISLPLNNERVMAKVSFNGGALSMTKRLQNGDVLKLPHTMELNA